MAGGLRMRRRHPLMNSYGVPRRVHWRATATVSRRPSRGPGRDLARAPLRPLLRVRVGARPYSVASSAGPRGVSSRAAAEDRARLSEWRSRAVILILSPGRGGGTATCVPIQCPLRQTSRT